MGDKVLLTAENVADVAEVETDTTLWRWFNGDEWRASEPYVGKVSTAWLVGIARITKWKPGREPKAPQATKWRKGYVTQKGDGAAPIGTVLCGDGKDIVTAHELHYFSPGWVVVREAPQPPAEEPWRRVVVEVRGKGHDAQVRFVGDRQGLSVISAHAIAAHAKPAPDFAKVSAMLDVWPSSEINRTALLEYVCGPEPKDGA